MLTEVPFSWLAVLLTAGVALDLLLGEPRRWHPLVGFGHFSSFVENRLNAARYGGEGSIAAGLLVWAIVVLPLVGLSWLAIEVLSELHVVLAMVAHVVLLYLALGLRSLRDHTMPIARALQQGQLDQARKLTSYIVSRDTSALPEEELAKAGVESLLENGNDAVFGTLFWFMIAGGPGVVLFRLANTLDAMWGYRSARFLYFGRAAARIDDVLNYLPARLTALSYAAMGQTRLAWHCWRKQAPQWSSPNAGPVMSAGAGALNISLGGAAIYDGEIEQRPVLGSGPQARGTDIARAWHLVARTTALWVTLILLVGVLHA